MYERTVEKELQEYGVTSKPPSLRTTDIDGEGQTSRSESSFAVTGGQRQTSDPGKIRLEARKYLTSS